MESMPNTMTAVVQPAYGLDAIGIGVRPVPSAGPGQLRIKVAASTVNPMDWHLATGSPGLVRLAEGFRRPRHEIPGREACGVVDQLGPGVTGFEVGQSVFGWMIGAFAEYAIADIDHLCLAPDGTTVAECAALPIAGGTALQAIALGDVAGRRVVVNGASGGVGHYAVQVARAHGAREVAGVCSSRNVEFVRGLGADRVFAYDREDFTSERWDVVIDCIGNRSDEEIKNALAVDGRWVVVGDQDKGGLFGPLPRLLARLVRWRFRSRSCHWFVQHEAGGDLAELARLVCAGQLRSHLSGTIALGEVRAGYDRIESGRTVGKLAIDVAGSVRAESTRASCECEVAP